MPTTDLAGGFDRLLFSMLNPALEPRSSYLVLFDPFSSSTRRLAIGPDDTAVGSGMGLCADERFVFHLSHSPAHSTWLSVLDRSSLERVHHCELKDVVDGHSLVRFESGMAVTSTGTDQVMFYEVADGAPTGEAQVLWAASRSGSDTHHVNSLAVLDGRLVCTAFGPPSAGWDTASDGYVFDISAEEKIFSGLAHPHSLKVVGGELLFCCSRDGLVRSGDDELLAVGGGYARGLDVGPTGTLYVGSSAARMIDTGDDGTAEPAGRFPPRGRCTLTAVPPHGVRTEWDLSGVGWEIFDVMTLVEELPS